MCVKLQQQSLVLLIRHLLYQQLDSDEHADVHVTHRQLHTHINNRLYFTTASLITHIFTSAHAKIMALLKLGINICPARSHDELMKHKEDIRIKHR